jgi:hypothetical protein
MVYFKVPSQDLLGRKNYEKPSVKMAVLQRIYLITPLTLLYRGQDNIKMDFKNELQREVRCCTHITQDGVQR